LRIAQLVSSYQPRIGGVETHVRHLAEGCAEAGDDVVVLTHQVSGSPPEERIGPVRVLRFPLMVTAANYQVSPGLSRYLTSHAMDFDLVHAHNYHTVVGHAAARSGLPFIFTPHYHGTGHTPFRALLHRLYRPVGAKQLMAADAVICVSEAEHTLLIRDFPGAADKVVTIPNGSDRRPRTSDGANRARPQEPVVLTVGRLERYKNVDLIIDAFRALPFAASLVIVGAGPDRGRLEQHAAVTDSGWPVVFTGRISDAELDRWYVRASVVTSASEHEAFGLTLTEGLTSGARVVASIIPAHAEIAGRAEAAAAVTLVDPRDTPEFTRVLAGSLAAGRVTGGTGELSRWADTVARTRDLYARVLVRGHLTHRREAA